MSSEYAQDKHNGGMAKYRSSEGKVKKIPCEGPVWGTVQDVLGGLGPTELIWERHALKISQNAAHL